MSFITHAEATSAVELFASQFVKPGDTYFEGHRARYIETLARTPRAAHPEATCIEFGASQLLQWALAAVLGYKHVHGTYFELNRELISQRQITGPNDYKENHKAFCLNLEEKPLPVENDTYDLVICCEVIEHMDVDPMHLLAEISRTTKLGGVLLMTTPSSTSARNVYKILHGYRPHFYMQYGINRSPYRHNIEYDVHAVAQLGEAAGFDLDLLETLDTFEAPLPEIIELLQKMGYPTDARGDNIFYRGHKAAGLRRRYPEGIYA